MSVVAQIIPVTLKVSYERRAALLPQYEGVLSTLKFYKLPCILNYAKLVST